MRSNSRDKILKKKPSKSKVQNKQRVKRGENPRLPPKIMTSDSSSINLVTYTHRTLETECEFPVIKVPLAKDLQVSHTQREDEIPMF